MSHSLCVTAIHLSPAMSAHPPNSDSLGTEGARARRPQPILDVHNNLAFLAAHQTASGSLTAMSPDCVIYRTHGNDGYWSYSHVSNSRADARVITGTFGSVILR